MTDDKKKKLTDSELMDSADAMSKEISILTLNGRYFKRKGDAVYMLSNFCIEPVELIYMEEEAEMVADFVTVTGRRHRISFPTADFSNSQRFKSVLNRKTIDLSWYGSESDLELLKTYLAGLMWPSRKGVKAIGIYRLNGQYVFVDADQAVDEHGVPVNGIVQIERYKGIESTILKEDDISSENLVKAGNWILSYNEPAKTVAILSWCSGCFLKQHLHTAGIKFPHLFLIGEAGSGKSTTLEYAILPLFCMEHVQAATQVTAFTLMKASASSNLIPLCMDEFKPSKMDRIKINALYNHFRDSYDGHNGVRGRADQSIAVFRLEAPIVVAGEESADEAAIRERSIEILFTKKDLRSSERREAFNQLCMSGDILREFGRTLLTEALGTSAEDAVAWHAEAVSKFKGEMPGRVVNNLSCCYAGLKLIERICHRYELQWNEVFPLTPEQCVKALGFGAEEYLLDGGTHNKSIVEQTFEVMSRMGLLYGEDYSLNLENTELFIRLSRVYDRYTKYRKEYAVGGEVLSYSQFRKQLKHSDLLIAANAQKRLKSGNTKGYIIDYKLLKERADVEGFEP